MLQLSNIGEMLFKLGYAVPFVIIYDVGQVMPVEVTELPLLEKLCLEHNKLSVLPPEIGKLKNLKILRVDNNMLISVPGERNLEILILVNRILVIKKTFGNH